MITRNIECRSSNIWNCIVARQMVRDDTTDTISTLYLLTCAF